MPPLHARPTALVFPRSLRALMMACGLGLGALVALPAAANTVEAATQALKAGDHAKALEQINRFLATKPKDAQGRFVKGLILTGMNKPTDAIAVFKKLTEDFPELPEPYNNLAVIYAQQKQFDKARDALEQAIRTHPAYATAHENLGDIYSRLASQAYGKALQIDSSNASAQTKLAMINDLVGSPGKVGAGTTAPVTPPQPVVIASAKPASPNGPPPAAPAPSAESAKALPPKAEPPKAETAKPAPAKPESTKTEPPQATPAKAEPAKPVTAASGDPVADITVAIDGWLAAWSKKDVRGYLGYYAKSFQAPNGQARKAWEAERQQRVGKPGKIEVGRDKLAIKVEGEQATVRFRQNYKSAGFNSSSGKTLVLVKQDGKWLIQQERVGG